MSTLPKIAIITRTKNRPFFLERCIQSVQAQTYKDYIHVILNDGGDKKAVEAILQKYPDAHRKVIHNSKSVGLVKALNQAIKAVDSEYIAILDDDDAWHKDRLKLGLEAIVEQNAAASVVSMEIVIEDITVDGIIKEISRQPHPESWTGEVSLYKQAHRNYLSNGAVMYARSLYNELDGYDESLRTAEDWDFGIRLLIQQDAAQVMSDIALVYYHQRPDVQDSDLGNSVKAGVRVQEQTITILRNRYLRNDIQKGVFGIGYIMNASEEALNNVVRIEGHINRASEDVKAKIREGVQEIDQRSFISRLRKAIGK